MRHIRLYDTTDFRELTLLWERSVRATHSFLSEEDIAAIRANLPTYFANVVLYAITDGDKIGGFIGLSDNRIEMLFVDADKIGRGFGTILINHAVSLGATHVDVNEQNPDALAFYQAKGFRVAGRSDLDSDGRPFPILHLSL